MKFVLGLITGVVAGMLLAPDNGKKNLENLKRNYPKYKAQLNNAVQQVKIAYNDVKKGFKLTQEKLPQEQPLPQNDTYSMDTTVH
jgi:gas vesicle protein